MVMYIKEVSTMNLRPDLPQLRTGQTVKVHQKIKEGEKERIQMFEGQIIAAKHGHGMNATITVRRIASGVGVERIFPIHSPTVAKIEVVKNVRAKRSKLYYTREGREAKVLEIKK
ncbi:MAG: 50S ribosomal protein L19 [bacterium]|nr:50S ribosomal protein L19 [bacterium]